MSLTAAEVRHVAQLARLGLTADQVRAYAGDLGQIVALFEVLARVDTAAVVPMAHPLDLSARLRRDEPVAVTQRETFQALAPAATEGFYRVPKVIE